MGDIYWLDNFLMNYNIVKLMAVLFVLGQLIALRNRDAKLSLHLQFSFILSFIGVYALNYILFLTVGVAILYSTLLLEIVLTMGLFFYPIVRYIDRKNKLQQEHLQEG